MILILVSLMCTTIVPFYGFYSFIASAASKYENSPTSYNYPIKSIATTGRGYTSSHNGVDLTIAKGTAVYASKSGTVEEVYSGCKNYNGASSSGKDCKACGCTQSKVYMNGSGYKAGYYCNNGYGNGIVIKNDDGKYCHYGHLSVVNVKIGDKVTTDTKIGEVGSSGCSTGAHLHFAITKTAGLDKNSSYDPFSYIFPGFRISLINNQSGSVNPRFKIEFPWEDFEAQECKIYFGESTSSMTNTSNDIDINTPFCYYDLGKKFGNLTKGKTYYIKVSVKKNNTTFTSDIYSFVAGSGNKMFLNYSQTIPESILRYNLVQSFFDMATIKWTCGSDFTVKVGSGSQTYYKGKTYYGLPYAQKKDSSALTLDNYKNTIYKNDGLINGFVGQSDCSTSLGVVYKKVFPLMDQLWSPSEFTKADNGFNKVGTVGDYSSLLPGDILYKSGHVMMVVSVDNAKKTVKVIHQSSGYFSYNINSETTGNSQTTMDKRNCSWGVNQDKTFSVLAADGCQGYRYTELGDEYGPCVSVVFDGNGGTASKAAKQYVVGDTYGNTLPSATRDGYAFDGWYTAANGGTRINPDTTVLATTTTMYARWTQNQTDALKVGHVYRIYNENSGLVLASTGSDNGDFVKQYEAGTKGNAELWFVRSIDEDGYYNIESLNGRNALDLDKGDTWSFGTYLQVWENTQNKQQKFSVIKRADKDGYSGLYSLHPKNSGRVIDIKGKSKESGGYLHQWYYHGGANQLFYFVEETKRTISFYDNLNNNYIASPAEEYEHIQSVTPSYHYSSRNTEYLNVVINPDENSLVINALKAGSSGKDMIFHTTLNGSYNYDHFELNEDTMVLEFRAKSSVDGAKMYFRWGYDVDNYQFVNLTTDWQSYRVEMPRTKDCGRSIHPYIDSVCTVEMTDIALYEKDTEEYYIGDTDSHTEQTIIADIYNAYSCETPVPNQEKAGYVFDGWYTKRVGGVKVADVGEYYDVSSLAGDQRLYAHWSKDASDEPVFVNNDKAVFVDDMILVVAQTSLDQLLSQSTEGAYVTNKDGEVMMNTSYPATGMIFVFANDKKASVIVKGDVDCDGHITSADARLTLRRSVGLEMFKEWTLQYIAANVDDDISVSAADARLILRASVGLENPALWIK